jgi:cellulose biosynthesis protein BcsQ
MMDPTTPAIATKEPRMTWALLLSSKPSRREELISELEATKYGQAVLKVISIDPAVARSFDDAKGALRGGTSESSAMHFFLIIGGEMASKMRKTEIEKLQAVALRQDKLIIMGLADNETERKALDELDIRWILRRGAPGAEILAQFQSAKDALSARMSEERRNAATATGEIHIHKHSGEGLFPRQAVIAVHATKGGVGKTSVAANLAYGLSLSGERTILIDLNADSAHIDRLYSTLLFRGRNAYQDREELFASKGLSWLSKQVQHQNAAQKIDPQALNDAVLTLIDERDQHLDLLPGVYDQSEYEGGPKSPMLAMLSRQEWITEMLNSLVAPRTGWSYVVVDTGINHYTSFARTAIARAELLLIVVNASAPSEIDSEAQTMANMLASTSLGRYGVLRGQRLIVANMMLPRGTQYAPTLDDVKKSFAFFEPVDVLPVAFDLNAKLVSEHEGLPILAVKESTLPLVRSPMRADMQTLVNTVIKVYGDDGKTLKKPGRHIFGR